jgi:prepilin-type N-terminal cleavage/methylation domain-containing protein
MIGNHAARRGFTLIEATISLVIVSVVAVAGLSAVSVARKSRTSINDMILARMYADAVMTEILSKRYRDALEPNNPLGPDSSDDVLGLWTRLADDVDDYDGHTITPVSDANMRPLSDGQWGAGIGVSWVDANDPTQIVSEESGVKRITIAIFKGDRIVFRAMALRTLGADQMKAVATP